jgi:WhiB family redox-sensing transcriptional regulator
MTWRNLASCQGSPVDFHSTDESVMLAAKRICRECPVQPSCLEEALVHEEAWGVWAGTSPRERQRIIARRERLPHQRRCEVCRAPFTPRNGHHLLCSPDCAAVRTRRRKRQAA